MPVNFAPTSLDHVALWVDEREPARRVPLRPPRHARDRGDRHVHARRHRRQAGQADALRRGRPAPARRARARGAAGGRPRLRGWSRCRSRSRGATTAWRPSRRRRACRSGWWRARDVTSTSTTSCCRSRIPRLRLACFEELGFERRPGRDGRRGRPVRARRPRQRGRRRPPAPEPPGAARGRRARASRNEAEGAGFEIDDVKDATNTFAVFLRGPEGVRVEYVEHKPGFALV